MPSEEWQRQRVVQPLPSEGGECGVFHRYRAVIGYTEECVAPSEQTTNEYAGDAAAADITEPKLPIVIGTLPTPSRESEIDPPLKSEVGRALEISAATESRSEEKTLPATAEAASTELVRSKLQGNLLGITVGAMRELDDHRECTGQLYELFDRYGAKYSWRVDFSSNVELPLNIIGVLYGFLDEFAANGNTIEIRYDPDTKVYSRADQQGVAITELPAMTKFKAPESSGGEI